MQTQDSRHLLCTFTNPQDYKTTANEVKKFYDVYSNRIFVFSNRKNPKELYLTYNVLNMVKGSPKFLNTILIHRKKEFNCLYSLNALNVLIKEECGCLNPLFILDWKLYSNSLVISGDVSIRIIPLKIFEVFE